MVYLNVGGTCYETTVATLAAKHADSRLAGLCQQYSGSTADRRLFIDRDGPLFRHVLNWLQTGALPAYQHTPYDVQALRHEAAYYGLTDMVRALDAWLTTPPKYCVVGFPDGGQWYPSGSNCSVRHDLADMSMSDWNRGGK